MWALPPWPRPSSAGVTKIPTGGFLSPIPHPTEFPAGVDDPPGIGSPVTEQGALCPPFEALQPQEIGHLGRCTDRFVSSGWAAGAQNFVFRNVPGGEPLFTPATRRFAPIRKNRVDPGTGPPGEKPTKNPFLVSIDARTPENRGETCHERAQQETLDILGLPLSTFGSERKGSRSGRSRGQVRARCPEDPFARTEQAEPKKIPVLAGQKTEASTAMVDISA